MVPHREKGTFTNESNWRDNGRHNRRQRCSGMKNIKPIASFAVEKHLLGDSILDRKESKMKFKKHMVISTELPKRDEVLSEKRDMKQIG